MAESEESWHWDLVNRETKAVRHRIGIELEKWPLIEMLTRHLGSLLYGASSKLIAISTKDGRAVDQDQALVLTFTRLFSECFAGYDLVRQGLITQSIVLLRSAFEISTQGILFVEDHTQASRWLKGKEIHPKDVRELTSMPQEQRALYNKLSRLAHPNKRASQYFAIPFPKSDGTAVNYIFGGWYAPKEAGQIAIQFIWAQLVLLESFYRVYAPRLEANGELWVKGLVEGWKSKTGTAFDYDWQTHLSLVRYMLQGLRRDHETGTIDDKVERMLALSDLPEESKKAFRQEFQVTKSPGEDG